MPISSKFRRSAKKNADNVRVTLGKHANGFEQKFHFLDSWHRFPLKICTSGSARLCGPPLNAIPHDSYRRIKTRARQNPTKLKTTFFLTCWDSGGRGFLLLFSGFWWARVTLRVAHITWRTPMGCFCGFSQYVCYNGFWDFPGFVFIFKVLRFPLPISYFPFPIPHFPVTHC